MSEATAATSGNFVDLTAGADPATITATLDALLAEPGTVLAIGVGTDEKAVTAKAVVKAKVDEFRGTCRAAWLASPDVLSPQQASDWFPGGPAVVFLKRGARMVAVRLNFKFACSASDVVTAFDDAGAR